MQIIICLSNFPLTPTQPRFNLNTIEHAFEDYEHAKEPIFYFLFYSFHPRGRIFCVKTKMKIHKPPTREAFLYLM